MGEREKNMMCIYCLGKSNQKITREHVISKIVLKTIFGLKNENITKSNLFGDKQLENHEQTIKDVCEKCNKLLSHYDLAGGLLVKKINTIHEEINVKIPINFESTMWLIKTHLNFIRLFPEKWTKKYYPISQDIYSSIIEGDKKSLKLIKIFFEAWESKPYFFDKNSKKRIQFFSYKNVCFPHQRIIVSNLRIKWLDTFILLPSDLDYSNYEKRVKETLEVMSYKWKFDLQELNLPEAINNGNLNISKFTNIEEILKNIK